MESPVNYLKCFLNNPKEQSSLDSQKKIAKCIEQIIKQKISISIIPLKCLICKNPELLSQNPIICPCGQISHKKCLKDLCLKISPDLTGSKIEIKCPNCEKNLDWTLCFSKGELEKILKKSICPICQIVIQFIDDSKINAMVKSNMKNNKIDNNKYFPKTSYIDNNKNDNKPFFQCECKQKFHQQCLRTSAKDVLSKTLRISSLSKLELAQTTRQFYCTSCSQPLDFISCFTEFERQSIAENKENMKAIKTLLEQDKKEKTERKCGICEEIKNVDQEFITLECEHRFCKECLQNMITLKIDEAKCSDEEMCCPLCQVSISVFIIKAVLSAEKFQIYDNFILHHNKNLLENNEKTAKCPKSNCSFFFIMKSDVKITHYTCPQCKELFCVNGCKKAHEGKKCEEVKNEENDDMDKFAKENKMQKCPKCKAWVLKEIGCNHVTCHCGTQFCCVCGSLDWNKCGDKYKGMTAMDRVRNCRIY